MKKRVLIINGNKITVVALALLFSNLKFTALNSEPALVREEIAQTITRLKPDIILLDHELGSKDTGLDIAEVIPKENILILSTSILVTSSRGLTDSYRNAGVHHFPGETFQEIMKCIEGNCECYLPAASIIV